MHNANNIQTFKQKALNYANRFEYCCLLDSNDYPDVYGKYNYLLAIGAEKILTQNAGLAFDRLKAHIDQYHDWCFGLFAYDLKNELEQLESRHPDLLHFPDLHFFIPQHVIALGANGIQVLKGDKQIVNQIWDYPISTQSQSKPSLNLKAKLSAQQYLQRIAQIKAHIARGDIYEMNFCQEFFVEDAEIDPIEVYSRLSLLSPTPFSAMLKLGDKYILSASPERFLAKKGNKIISQPIKGTIKRGRDDKDDELQKQKLKNSHKEQSENVMIVDLVRNDLSKVAKSGTVKVEELFGIYTFPQVHQMISTISAELAPNIHPIEAIRQSFPMGSMTGAPKLRAMQLIDDLEESKRGAYSGALGYFCPDGDFDFNVIIRTILYNQYTKYLSFQVGSAITYAADDEQELEECMVKAKAMLTALAANY